MNTFEYKGFGRIFVKKEEDVQKVKDIIKNLDDFEFPYMPNNFITVGTYTFRDAPLVHVGKFSPDMDSIEERCKSVGIEMEWFTATHEDYGDDPEDVW